MNGDSSLGMSVNWSNLDMALDHQVKCRETRSPCPKIILYRYADSGIPVYGMLTIFVRESTCSTAPMPGIAWELKSPIEELILIESVAGPSRDKCKGKEPVEMDKGKPEKAQSQSLTISEFEGVFHGGEDSAFVYNWINDEHGDSWSDRDMKETEWLMDQSYQDTSEEPIE
jgi:hypothetical protein